MKLLRYSEYSKSTDMAEEFLNIIGNIGVNESDNTTSVIKKISSDLKLDTKLLIRYNEVIQSMMPIVRKLVSNTNLNIDLTTETVVLMTVSSFTIAYIEENKSEERKFEKDSKSMLEELRLRGVGNGIIKKLVFCIKSIENLFKILFKDKSDSKFFTTIRDTKISIPVLDAISYMVNKYNMNVETLPSNFTSLGLGVTTLIAKNGLEYVIDILHNKLNIDKEDILRNINDIDDPILKRHPNPEYIGIDKTTNFNDYQL